MDFNKGWRAISSNCCLFNGRTLLFGDPKLTRDDPVRFFSALHACLYSTLWLSIAPLFFILLSPLLHSTLSIFSLFLSSLSLSLSLSLCLPPSSPYIPHILTESIARTRHTWLFSSVPILISRARNSRTLRSLGVLKRNVGTSPVFAAHRTRPLPPWRPVARSTLAAFISATMKGTHLHTNLSEECSINHEIDKTISTCKSMRTFLNSHNDCFQSFIKIYLREPLCL